MKHPRRSALAVLGLSFALLAAACRGADDGDGDGTNIPSGTPRVQDGGRVVFAIDQEPVGWNPNKPSDYALGALTQHVLPRPFRVRSDFRLAIDDDLLVSADQTDDDPQTIVYVIRKDAVWSDGTPISGDDFTYLWEQTIDPDNAVASTNGYEDIDTITSSDNGRRVTVTFERPYGDWKALFSHLLPAHVMQDLEGGWDGLDGENIPPVSGGPFLLKDYHPSESVRLVANRKYWGKKKPVLDEVVVRFGIAAADLPAALENDEVDVAYPQPQLDLVQEVTRLAPEISYEVGIGLTFEHLDFDVENEFLRDRAVRRAIAYALDEEELVARTARGLTDDAEPLYNRMYVPGQPEYEAHGEEYQGVDLQRARQTLERAGFTRGRNGTYRKDGRDLSLRLSTTGDNALRETTQELIKVQLRAAGIHIEIDNDSGTSVFGRIFAEDPDDRDFDIALFSWVRAPFAGANEPLYTTGSAVNVMHYTNPDVDDLFEEARTELDAADAADTYNRIDQRLWSDLPTIPLYASPSFLTFRTTLVNVEDNVSTAGPMWNMYEWAISAD